MTARPFVTVLPFFVHAVEAIGLSRHRRASNLDVARDIRVVETSPFLANRASVGGLTLRALMLVTFRLFGSSFHFKTFFFTKSDGDRLSLPSILSIAEI